MGKKNKSSQKDLIVIEKSKLESILMVCFLLIALIASMVLLFKGFTTVSNIENKKDVVSMVQKNSFSDKELNYVMLYPNQWVLSEIDKEIMDSKSSVVTKASEGRVFNLLTDRLDEEVISVLIVNNPTIQEDGYTSNSQFMSLTFLGDADISNEEKLSFLSNMFRESIDTANKDVDNEFQLLKSNITSDGGFYIEAKVKYEKGILYYSQYSEVVGVNIATAIIGSSVEDTTLYEKVVGLVSSIKTK